MSKLIMLKGIGMQGKSHIVTELTNRIPDLYHLPQTNRKFFKLHPEFNAEDVRIPLYEFFKSEMKKVDLSDGLFITERSYIDYSIYVDYRGPEKSDKVKLRNGKTWKQDAIDEELKFFSNFDQVDIYVLQNLDIDWMYEYFHSLPKDDIHKKFYASRGMFLSMQDRWMSAWRTYVEHLQSLQNVTIKYVEFREFIKDNNNLAKQLIEEYK